MHLTVLNAISAVQRVRLGVLGVHAAQRTARQLKKNLKLHCSRQRKEAPWESDARESRLLGNKSVVEKVAFSCGVWL